MVPHPLHSAPHVIASRTILLVEDEPFVREATRQLLEAAGFRVFVAQDAFEAKNLCTQLGDRIVLVMTDLVLPGSTGLQLGEDLRSRFPNLQLLVTSGYSDAENEIESPSAHTYFLAKPYTRNALVGKIEAILESCAVASAEPLSRPPDAARAASQAS